MAEKVAISKKHAKAILAGSKKATAKGKKRRTEIQADAELEDRITDAVSKAPRKRQDATADSRVGAGALRGVVGETMARVYEEVWPGMKVRERHGDVEIQIAEEAYITVLSMIVGHADVTPRKPLKIRESEISNAAQYCHEHA